MKPKYQCDFCYELFDTESQCLDHELTACDDNPKVKSCETCKNSVEDCPNGGKIYYSCKTGHKAGGTQSWKQHCEFWEWDHGYAH